jgi:hypothetical protein
MRCQGRWLACALRAVVSVLLFHDTKGSCASILLHVGELLRSLMWAIVVEIGVLLVRRGSWGRDATGNGCDGLVVGLVLLATQEEEYG